MNWQAIQSQLDRLHRRILMGTAPMMITATDDSGPIHRVQARVNGTPEVIDNLQVMHFYGLTSHQPVGSDASAMFLKGDRSNGVVISTNSQKFRLRNLEQGEVALYTQEGDVVKLGKGHVVSITTTGTVAVSAPTVNIGAASGGNATINLTGDIKASGTITADTINAPNGHVGS